MKVILSRKGFDSASGGAPSPILPDGRLVSLPIPDKSTRHLKYSQVKVDRVLSYDVLLSQLSIRVDPKSEYCHLDPDLNSGSIPRLKGWRSSFGQCEAAQTHLENHEISLDDLFLFFGWFRKTVYNEKLEIKYDSNDRLGRHIIFGYFQIGQILKVDKDTEAPKWLEYHPHCDLPHRKKKKNMIYIARDKTSWNENLPGAGLLKYNDKLVLTAANQVRSHWNLPKFFRDVNISYHQEKNWKEGYFQSAGRGQEFVIDESKDVANWACGLTEECINY
jgi:hypothetical protein